MSSYQKGFGAYKRGDYDTAMTEWRPLAERGDGLNPSVGRDFRIVCTELFPPKMWICASNF